MVSFSQDSEDLRSLLFQLIHTSDHKDEPILMNESMNVNMSIEKTKGCS